MKIFIDGEQLGVQQIQDYLVNPHTNCFSDSVDWKSNVLKLLHNWQWQNGFSFGYQGNKFLNLTTSGTTGFPQQVGHDKETIEQVVDSNIKIFNLNKNSRILSFYSPRGIAFSVLSVYLAKKLDCELYIESFKGIDYVNRLHDIRPTHTLLLPNIWKVLHRHPKWKTLDLSSVDTMLTGSDFTPTGMLDELRDHKPAKVFNVYGSTEVPPVILYSEHENTYTKDSIVPGIDFRIVDNEIHCKWTTQKSFWKSGDLVQGDIDKFVLNGRRANMFKQDHIRVYPEMIEKTVILGGADLCLCQQIGNHCVVHYTGEIENLDNLKAELNHVPRLRFKKVDEIKVDNNLKKIIRNQTFE